LARIDLGKASAEILNADPRDALEEFLASLESSGADRKTVKAYRAAIKDFMDFVGWKKLSEITSDDVKRWRLERLRNGFPGEKSSDRRSRQATLYYYSMFLRRFFEWAGLNIDVPRVKKPPRREPPVLTESDIEKLLKASRDRLDELIVSLLFETGLRAQEALSLTFRDVDLYSGEIHVRNAKYGIERVVFMGPRTWSIIAAEAQIRNPHPDERVLPISYSGLYKRLKSLAKRAGIDPSKVRPHVLRHTFATEALKRGVNIVAVQRLLGHRDLRTTQIYLHMLREDLKRQYLEAFYRTPNYGPPITWQQIPHQLGQPIPATPLGIQQLEAMIRNTGPGQGSRYPLQQSPQLPLHQNRCPVCGSEVPPQARFCPYCGHRIG